MPRQVHCACATCNSIHIAQFKPSLCAPPWGPTNLGWTFNPQNEIATFRRVPKSVPSPQPPMCNRLRPPETLAEDADLPHAAPAYIRSLRSPCPNQPVLRLTKQHRDALKIKMHHFPENNSSSLFSARSPEQRVITRPTIDTKFSDSLSSPLLSPTCESGGVCLPPYGFSTSSILAQGVSTTLRHQLPCYPSGPLVGAFLVFATAISIACKSSVPIMGQYLFNDTSLLSRFNNSSDIADSTTNTSVSHYTGVTTSNSASFHDLTTLDATL
eukprot:jgi/Psemu1/17985/gm1.17985_g